MKTVYNPTIVLKYVLVLIFTCNFFKKLRKKVTVRKLVLKSYSLLLQVF